MMPISEEFEFAVCHRDWEKVRRLVLEGAVDVNFWSTEYDGFCTTALHLAAQHGNADIVHFLLENNANVNAVNTPFGDTPLHCAALFRSFIPRLVCCLLNHGADPNATNARGFTPLKVFIRSGNLVMPMLETFLSCGANSQAFIDYDALHSWARMDNTAAMTVLFNHLRSSSATDEVESVLMCTDSKKRFPFHYVKSVEMAQLLLEQSLSSNPRLCHDMLFALDGEGKSSLDVCRDCHDYRVCKYLESFSDLTLTVPETTLLPLDNNEHRDKRQRFDDVRINPRFDKVQRIIADAFLDKLDGWSTFFQPSGGTSEGADYYYVLPDDLKYPIIAHLSPADVLKILPPM